MTTTEELDRFARDYYLNPDVTDIEIEDAAQRESVNHIVRYVEPSDRILHMGWGTGIVQKEMHERGYYRMSLVEGAYSLANDAADSGLMQVVHHNLFEEFGDGGWEYDYDVVIAGHVLEHLEDPCVVLRRVETWLRPGGKIIAIVPNAESFHRRIAVMMGLISDVGDLSARDAEVGHIQSYDVARLHDDLDDAGFNPIHTFGYQFKPLHNAALIQQPAEYRDALNRFQGCPVRLLANIGMVGVKR